MSAPGEAKDARASRAQPRREARGCERGRHATIIARCPTTWEERARRRLARDAAALAALLVATGCASAPQPDRYEQKRVRDHAMSSYVVHEECVRVAAGERVEYYFTSTFPIDFNIHYHEGSAVVMPITRSQTLEDSAVFTARIPQEYCLMWEAGPTGATIGYGLRLRPSVEQ